MIYSPLTESKEKKTPCIFRVDKIIVLHYHLEICFDEKISFSSFRNIFCLCIEHVCWQGPVAECDLSQILVKKDDSGYGGDDLSLIDDLDSLDDPLPASNIQSNMGQPR